MVSPTCPPAIIQHLTVSSERAVYLGYMDIHTPETPGAVSGSVVDASRPFRSVKEAVAIFGERLFLGEMRSSPKGQSFGIGQEESYISEHTQSASKPSSVFAETAVKEPSLDEPPCSSELTLSLSEPPNNAESLNRAAFSSELYQSPQKPTNPAAEIDVGSPLDGPSYSSEITQSPGESPSMASRQLQSPMYQVTPSPRNLKNESNGNIVHGNDLVMLMMVLKKLEAELQETKAELKQLKQRGSETEVAVASLNAELHKNMPKTEKAEAATKSTTSNQENTTGDLMRKTIDSPILAQILSISDYEGYRKANKLRTKKLMKKKPIVPLVTDMFPWKKKSSPHDISSPLFSSQIYFP